MIAIEFRFPAGRWHATAWGTHVNEGVPEWPPSPWRLCRALWATWFHKHQESIQREEFCELIDLLIEGPLPRYSLPPAVAAHTRHFMPVIAGRKESKTKVFDTFVQVSKLEKNDRLLVAWNIALDARQKAILSSLLVSMSYLGRAESLVEASLLPEELDLALINAAPTYSEEVDETEETIRLLAPLPQKEFSVWRGETLENAGRRKLNLPERVRECLLLDTEEWKKAKWSQPPGSRWVVYRRPKETFGVQPQFKRRRPSTARPTIARFVINGDVLPDITQALSLGERFHRALVKWSDNSPVFSGCDPHGKPLKGHQHAFYLSEPEGKRGEIRYVTVFAPSGFGLRERAALERVRSVWDYDSRRLKLTLVSIGDLNEQQDENRLRSLFGPSRSWESITPFIPTRHPKTRNNGIPKLDHSGLQIGSPAHDFLRLFQLRFPDYPLPTIESIPGPDLSRRLVWLNYQRYRRHGKGVRANSSGSGFRLTFPVEISGPIALGYGAHYGLGACMAVKDRV